jgi:excisionase family DNA binding protein
MMDPGVRATKVEPPRRPYTVRQFAELADLSLNAVYAAISRGELRAVRIGRAIRLPADACDKLLRGDAD